MAADSGSDGGTDGECSRGSRRLVWDPRVVNRTRGAGFWCWQKRIVAKVEHLMKLCDALEAALRRREDRAAKLAEAVVQEMVA